MTHERRMRRRSAWAAAATVLAALFGPPLLVGAETAAPRPILPDDLRWTSPPGNPAVQGAWVVGGEHDAGPYVFRVKLAAGARIQPHTHPDVRSSTVLAGTLYVGFGPAFDEANVVAVPVGGVYVAPAAVAHYVWAKDGAVVYQETGTGPTATTPAAP
jgi:quercetin dioxygenase-like cupin family protein